MEQVQRGFARQALTLSGGTLAAQLIPLAVAPLLSRLYGAADFGRNALLLAALGVTGQLACLKFDLAVVVVEEEDEAGRLVWLCLTLGALSALLLLVTRPLWAAAAGALGVPAQGWSALLAPGTLLVGLSAALSALALRVGCLRALTAATVARAAATVAAQLLLTGWGDRGLSLGYLAGQAVGAALLWAALGSKLPRRWPGGRALWQTARRHPGYPGYTAVGGLAAGLASGAGSFLLSAFYSPVLVGCYAMVNRLLALPLTVLSGPVGQLCTRGLSACPKRERRRLYLRVSAGLALPALALLAGGALLAPLLIPILGAQWAPAVPMLRAMLPLCALRLVVVPVSTAGIVAGRQGLTMLWQLSLLAATAGAVAVAATAGLDVVGCLWLMSLLPGLCYAVWYGCCLIWLGRGEAPCAWPRHPGAV